MKEEALLDTIGLIYEAVLDPNQWQKVLAVLVQATNSMSASFTLFDDKLSVVNYRATYGQDPLYQEAYQKHYFRLEPWLPLLKTLPISFVNSQKLVPQKAFFNTEIYYDWCKPQQMHWFAGGNVAENKTGIAKLGIQRTNGQGDFDREDIRRLNLLTPHFQRALEVNQLLGAQDRKNRVLSATLDELSVGILLVDENERIVYMNAVAEEIVKSPGGMDIHRGTLCTSETTKTSSLEKLVHEAVQTGKGRGLHQGGMLAVTRENKQPLNLCVSPVRFDRTAPINPGKRICAAVIISRPEDKTVPTAEVLCTLYGLTKAEARLAVELAQGKTLKEIAEAFFISKETVRSQLKAVFQKTWTKRQSELVGLILSCYPGVEFKESLSNPVGFPDGSNGSRQTLNNSRSGSDKLWNSTYSNIPYKSSVKNPGRGGGLK